MCSMLFSLCRTYVTTVSPHAPSFFLNETATTEIYTLSLHDALPISCLRAYPKKGSDRSDRLNSRGFDPLDRKSTRLNSSHGSISYAVFCLKKKMRSQRAALFCEGDRDGAVGQRGVRVWRREPHVSAE